MVWISIPSITTLLCGFYRHTLIVAYSTLTNKSFFTLLVCITPKLEYRSFFGKIADLHQIIFLMNSHELLHNANGGQPALSYRTKYCTAHTAHPKHDCLNPPCNGDVGACSVVFVERVPTICMRAEGKRYRVQVLIRNALRRAIYKHGGKACMGTRLKTMKTHWILTIFSTDTCAVLTAYADLPLAIRS